MYFVIIMIVTRLHALEVMALPAMPVWLYAMVLIYELLHEVLWAIGIAAKGSTSKIRLKNTDLERWTHCTKNHKWSTVTISCLQFFHTVEQICELVLGCWSAHWHDVINYCKSQNISRYHANMLSNT